MAGLQINRITNANVYMDGNSFFGKAEEIDLGSVNAITSDFSGLGLVGLMELPDGLDKLEGKIIWTSLYEDAAVLTASPFRSVALQCLSNINVHTKPRAFIVCESLKRMWRRAHPATVKLWGNLDANVRAAVQNSNTPFRDCRPLTVYRDKAWLMVDLPSGRSLCYPSPRIEEGKITYMGVNPYTRKWERLATYGGKLAENATQAVARDVLAYAMPQVEKAGYKIVLSVHDELITEAPDTEDYSAEALAELMTVGAPWTQGLPLAAAGFETRRYYKG